ncbi:HAD-like domain-containing protein [Radiomyces spectabilis]|uniref:HAD-like domain-containing protein n=1 Tax=Radiomyces spectabilis TaxID=64574 RepID=UPI00221EEE8D|nr:HAD-like domain-containing protein [Radiomyces spectabilis]KAI8394314.1 HAD-like domain-containing protein [Radiomyces spectabilis]
MRVIKSLSEVLAQQQYDTIAIDIYGVIHNGEKPYPYTKEALRSLVTIGEQVILLSNSTRLSHVLSEHLSDGFDIPSDSYKAILSSGELTRLYLEDCAEYLRTGDIVQEHCEGTMQGNKLIGPLSFAQHYLKTGRFVLLGSTDWHAPLYSNVMPTIQPSNEASLEEVDFILLGSVTTMDFPLFEGKTVDPYSEKSVIAYFTPFLEACLRRQLPLLCANPDVWAPYGFNADGSQKLLICPGYIGEMYENMGGQVLYFGKPCASIYDFLLRMNVSDEKMHNASDRRVLCIGDNVATDVLGATSAGLDVAMVIGGVHSEELNQQEEEELKQQVRALCQKFNSKEPTYLIPLLKY